MTKTLYSLVIFTCDVNICRSFVYQLFKPFYCLCIFNISLYNNNLYIVQQNCIFNERIINADKSTNTSNLHSTFHCFAYIYIVCVASYHFVTIIALLLFINFDCVNCISLARNCKLKWLRSAKCVYFVCFFFSLLSLSVKINDFQTEIECVCMSAKNI